MHCCGILWHTVAILHAVLYVSFLHQLLLSPFATNWNTVSCDVAKTLAVNPSANVFASNGNLLEILDHILVTTRDFELRTSNINVAFIC